MPKIHTNASKYNAPSPTSGWQWQPYSAHYLSTLRSAISIIETKIKNNKPCNEAFKKLPSGKTFLQIWNDPSIWISFDPTNIGGRYGATLGKKHVTLPSFSLRMGQWTTAATLVHELAHVGGAGGNDSKAEDVLRRCLLKDLHDPNIIGKVIEGKKCNRSCFA